MKKKKFRIGDLAEKLGVEKFVIRFWEKEFGLDFPRSNGGQRFYDADDLSVFEYIKYLLYDKGFTINGAKKQLTLKQKSISVKINAPYKNSLAQKTDWGDNIILQIGTLKRQLIKLRELL